MESMTFQTTAGSLVLDGRSLELACQYGPSAGQVELIKEIQRWHEAKSGVSLDADQICITNGSQEGLFAASYLFLESGDPVAMTEPSYPGALAAFSAFTDNYLAIPQDERGMMAEALDEYLQRRSRKALALPKFLYVTPNCHNPAGVSMDTERRRQIYEIAERYDLLILEDDPYELLKFREDTRYPTFQSMDHSGRVIRLDSFSKVFVPGFRLGYVSGPKELVREFTLFKQGSNLHTSSFNQSVLALYLSRIGPEGLFARIRKNCEFYRANFEALEESLDRELGGRIAYNRPDGGFFLWLDVRQAGVSIDTFEMIGTLAREIGVLAIPGSGFSVTGSLSHCLRMSFSQQAPDMIREGVRRLKRMFDHYSQKKQEELGGTGISREN